MIALRGYQEDCIKRIREAMRRVRRVLLQGPTGSGKTIIFTWSAMAVATQAARILILGHRQEIVDQISEALKAFDVEHGCIGLAYCVSIAHSQSVAAMFHAAGYSALHIDGETPKDERRKAIAALGAGKLDLIINCALFTEGVDVPALGIVLMLRPTKSLGPYLQMCGRALRTAPGKRRALILDHAGHSLEHGCYDFPHQWSLDGRPKSKPLVRQCPQCGAVVEIAITECPECGFEFVRRVAPLPPRIPEAAPGELERVDAGLMHRLGIMPYKSLLEWIDHNPGRAEQARRARNYRSGWVYHICKAA